MIKQGDLVEIINVSLSQLNSIRSQQCNYDISHKDIIGNRYYVNSVQDSVFDGKPIVELKGWNYGGHFGGFFAPEQLKIIND